MAKLNVDQAFLRARKHQRKGEIEQARAIYTSVLATFPGNARAQKALAQLGPGTQTPAKALNPPKEDLEALVALIREGQLTRAIEHANALFAHYPNSSVLWNISGGAHKHLRDIPKAEQAFRKAIALNPAFPDAHHNIGLVLVEQGRLAEAITAFRQAVTLKPDFAAARFALGGALADHGQPEDAVTTYQHLIAKLPDHAAAYANMGNALRTLGKYDAAIAAFQNALQIQPDFAEAYNNLGVAQRDAGQFAQALASIQRAIDLNPDYAMAYNNMGSVLLDCDRYNDAMVAFQKALKLKPDYAKAYYHKGTALSGQGMRDKAIAAYQSALEHQPDLAEAEAKLLHEQQNICDWHHYDRIGPACERLGLTTTAVSPFSMLSMEDNAARHRQRSQAWVREIHKAAPLPRPAKPASRPERLRLGYFSADFYNHPCLYLMLGLLCHHDRARFEVFVYSYSRKKSGDLRQRAIAAVDHFIDIADMPDGEVIDLARSHALDIAIDLTGYTQNSRSGLLQPGLAPVQAGYTGYPGTMGADFITYLIADPTIIPDTQRRHYSENIICLPHSYLPNDNTLEIADTPTTRADFNLPEDAFVFCSFNNTYKISPREFDIWMRVLGQVEGSVLWLTKSNPWAEPNLRKEAAARGIDPARLIFAEKVPHPEHLARHRHADLFLDTFNYNAHTTASEALWAGLPLVTKMGDQFAARVAASLLKSIGLPDLITTTEQDYEALILDLATNRDKLSRIRDQLQINRMTQPLFNTEQNTRAFEDGLCQAYDLYFEGSAPRDIRVTPKHR